jgi:hypothetical protein
MILYSILLGHPKGRMNAETKLIHSVSSLLHCTRCKDEMN